jgi:hypothetical protein
MNCTVTNSGPNDHIPLDIPQLHHRLCVSLSLSLIHNGTMDDANFSSQYVGVVLAIFTTDFLWSNSHNSALQQQAHGVQ